MKISKLFHWLYAVIMLLPIFAIGVTSLVSTFNMSAKEEAEIVYKYKTNEVNSANDLVNGNIYKIDTRLISREQSRRLFYCKYIEVINFNNTSTVFDASTYGDTYRLDFFVDIDFNNFAIRLFNGNNQVFIILATGFSRFTYINFVLLEIVDTSIVSDMNIVPLNEIPIESVETHNLDTQEVFYRAIDKVQQSPLFNWAYNSFLVTPFAYIVSLFSMPTNSFVVMLLSYWLAISIIWLVFDLVMYIPLLVHRWIDRGILQ